MLSLDFALLDPSQVTVPRSDRQRKSIDTRDLVDSIRRNGVLNPIIITRDGVLVAGERRLTACAELKIKVPVRYIDQLSPIELQIIELEENLKRSDLPWRDTVAAVGRIHDLYSAGESGWTMARTGSALGFAPDTISKILRVYKDLDSPRLASATGWVGAYNLLVRIDERKMASVVADILEAGDELFGAADREPELPLEYPGQEDPELAPAPPPVAARPAPAPDPIIQADFLAWAPAYSGPRFNLIHCDFPYGINAFSGQQMAQSSTTGDLYADDPEIYWKLIESFCANLDRFASHSCHIMFWFSMQHYTRTLETFRVLAPSIEFNPTPLVWVKSDNAGVAPNPRWTPRQIYEVALLGRRGERPIVKVASNAYYAPTNKDLHPSTKTEPVLRHFFQMLVDETTSLLDPTCGSGSSLRAAEALGAPNVFGLELNPEHYANALAATRKFRALRQMSGS